MSRTFFRAVALATPLITGPLIGSLPGTPAHAQVDLEAAAALCLDLTQPPRDVGDACMVIANAGEVQIDSRISAAFRAGGAYQRIEAFADADRAYSVAIDFDPVFGEAYGGRAIVREKLDDVAGAEADHNLAIQLLPNDPVLVYNRGVFYFRADRETEARADFYTVIDLDPAAAWPHVYLGAMDDLAGADMLALASYERAFELDGSILSQFQRSMESQGFDPGLPGEYSPETRAGLIECMAIDCIIGVND